jgi:hypothetical protein
VVGVFVAGEQVGFYLLQLGELLGDSLLLVLGLQEGALEEFGFLLEALHLVLLAVDAALQGLVLVF